MELYIYSPTRQLLGIVESYEYLRWTRRYTACGDFELRAIATKENLAVLKMGHIIWKSDDDEAGFIEYAELTMDEQEFILVRGRFATGILARRIVWGTELLKGDLSAAVSQLITNHLIFPTDGERKGAGYAVTAPVFGVPVNTQFSYRNLLDAVTALCDPADVGIKTNWDNASRVFTFTLYKGADSQAVFSKEYENLNSQVYIQSMTDFASVALVAGEGEGEERQTVTVGSGSGESRYELFVDAKDLRSEDFGADYTAALTLRGQAKLNEQTARISFDASINPHGNLVYKEDFDLGQTVRVVSKAWGVKLITRITEIEETYDRDGLSLQVVFGRGLLTLIQKLKGGV